MIYVLKMGMFIMESASLLFCLIYSNKDDYLANELRLLLYTDHDFAINI